MSVLRQLRLVFGVRPQGRPSSGLSFHAPVVDLAAGGFPGFYWTAFFLTPSGASRYREKRELPWADSCAACDAPGLLTCVCRQRRGFGPFVWGADVLSSNVPCCEIHAETPAPLAMSVHNPGALVGVSVVGRCEAFLRESRLQALSDGEHEPPWVTFPDASPYVGWNQGSNEAWLHRAFIPFWQIRSAKEREDYLRRWSPSDDWAEWLHNRTRL